MRLTFLLFIYLGFMVPEFSSYNESSKDGMPAVSSYLNLEGTFRREFALEAVLEDHDGNIICSPLSVMMSLGKLAMGTSTRTEKELLDALGVVSREQLKPTFAQLITNLEYLPGVTLDMASRIYASTKNLINNKFAHNTLLVFKSTLQRIRSTNPMKTANTINQWVAEKTRNNIKKLIHARDITEETSLILVNAVYFASDRLYKFDETFKDNFFSAAGINRIPMMSREARYNYWKCDTLDAQIIEIPYEGLQSAMIVVLPMDDLRYFLEKLNREPDLLNSALSKMEITDVKLTMPQFKIESEINLNRLIEKIGVRTIFDETDSGLNGIIYNETVFVSKVIHKAIIEVTDLGTEAYAATAIGVDQLSDSLVTVKVNRPFLFYITAYRETLLAGVFNGNT